MVYSTPKEYPKLALPPPLKKNFKGYLPANITCKILDHYLDVPGIYDCKS